MMKLSERAFRDWNNCLTECNIGSRKEKKLLKQFMDDNGLSYDGANESLVVQIISTSREVCEKFATFAESCLQDHYENRL